MSLSKTCDNACKVCNLWQSSRPAHSRGTRSQRPRSLNAWGCAARSLTPILRCFVSKKKKATQKLFFLGGSPHAEFPPPLVERFPDCFQSPPTLHSTRPTPFCGWVINSKIGEAPLVWFVRASLYSSSLHILSHSVCQPELRSRTLGTARELRRCCSAVWVQQHPQQSPW